ncbi:chemotaxis protein CheW [Oscillatoria laete-virens NRMC-F 0139]|nr:chemotaxis protein CheW [Oscillatoria laete-virens]MDL5054413.1 chemotaxis protein CheW [Oscillatoria laete-virens NRMC-F 0139]
MSERDLIMMIFTPGFSTAAEVTRISGRGVGMDVVKTNIEKIGGSVDAFTKKGRGTTFKIKIPLTLAIIPALIVHCDSQRYAIPQVNLMELVRIDQNAGEQQIEYIHNAPVFRLRGNLLPLVSLGQILGVSNNVTTRKKGVSSIVVLKYLDKTFGLIVDEISDTQEIVVKPLSKQLKDIREFSGATITGDGQVALILDVMGVAQNVKISEETAEGALVFNQQVKTGTLTTQADSLLFFRVAGKAVMAMPLSEVARLEEIKTSSIQTAADREVVEYRGMILPLIRLSRLYRDGAGDAGGAETLPVIVHRHEDQLVGFVVDQILDVSDEEISTRNDSPTAGIRCSALIGERITDILDTARVVELYLSDFAGQAASGGLS